MASNYNANYGTRVASTLRPFNQNDTYAVAYSNELKGGLHTASDVDSMLHIPYSRRELGMMTIIGEDQYILINNPVSDITTEQDWKKVEFDTTTITVSVNGEIYTLKEILDKLYNNSKERYIQFINYVNTDKKLSEVETIIPFNCWVTEMICSVPYDTALTQDIQVALQVRTSASWGTIAGATITTTSKWGSIILPAPVNIVSGTRLRIALAGGNTVPTTLPDTVDSISTIVKLTF